MILIHIIQSKLDRSIRKEWEMSLLEREYPSYEKMISFLERFAGSLGSIQNKENSKQFYKMNKSTHSHSATFASDSSIDSRVKSCVLCKGEHFLLKCPKFNGMMLPERWTFVKDNRLCYNCLRSNHRVSSCVFTQNCKSCNKRHHTLLHQFKPEILSPVANISPLTHASVSCFADNKSHDRILLSTALIKVKSENGVLQTCRSIIDTGSQRCLITNSCRKKLNLPLAECKTTVFGLGNKLVEQSMGEVSLQFSAHFSNLIFNANPIVIDKITSELPNFFIEKDNWPYLKNLMWADPNFDKSSQIDLVIGAELAPCLFNGKVRFQNLSGPTACGSKLGGLLTDTIEEATCHIPEVNNLLSSAGFSLRKWRSNVPEVLSGFSEQVEDRHNLRDFESDSCVKILAAFIAALKRFMYHRGKPSDIFSDNGTNFTGANNILREQFDILKASTIQKFISNERINWHFIPPSAPNFGGIWEAGIKSFKFNLLRCLKSQILTFEELSTLTTQIEACLNSRPICPLSSDSDDFNPLTPGHFLIGKPLTAPPESNDDDDVPINYLDRWSLNKKKNKNVFWERWNREYLNNLQQRLKWQKSSPNIKEGDLILLKDAISPPAMYWSLGRITKVVPGVDGKVRVVENCRYNSQAAPPDGDRLKLAAPPLLTLGRRVSHSMMQQKTLSLGIAASTTLENKYLSRCETARDRVDGSLVESAANSVVNTESKRTIRLPKVELPKFKGNLEDWLSWWGQFIKINDDETLGDVDKFHYLLQAVVEGSRAQRLVCSYPITEDNYPKVVQALKDRFGDKNLLIEHYIRRLLKLVVSNARKENLPLDEIYDDLTAHLKNLESLGVNTEMAGVFLYPLVESSLPLDIIQVWQRNPAVGYGIKEEGAENGDKSDASGRLQALMDFLRDEVKGAERMAFAKENFEGNSSMRATGSQLKTPRKTPPTVSNLFGSAFKRKCIFCQRDNHLSSRCFVASRFTPSERDQRIKEAKVCFKCLKGNHLKKECRADIKCRNCGKYHLDIFCNKIALKQGGNNSFKGEKSKVVNEGNATGTGVNMSARTCANDILLMTSVAKLKGAKETKEVKVLFDTGSHYSYIKRSIVEKLGLNKIGEISLEKSLFGGGNMKEALHGKYVLKLGSLTNKIDVDIVALDQPEICAKIPTIPRGRLLYKLKRKKIYIHPSNFRNEEIDILIGSDYFGQLLTGKVVHLGEDLTAVETKLGWTLMGQSPVVCKEDKVQIALNMLVARNNLKDLWELDVLGIQDPIEVVSKKKRETELKEHFGKNIKRDEDQRYSVALPWKCERKNIPSNLEIAQRRLEACTSKLRKEKRVIEYSTILQEWEREGLIERIEENSPQKRGHYLPHRPVFKAESRTTPLRPVFDASCRFREKGIVVLTDIRKAFQMITVQLQDQDFLRFLWWDQTDPMKLTVFRHKRVVFGLNCSPLILGAVIDHHLNSVQGPAAEIAKTMARSFYMDNLVTSLSSQEEVQQFQNTAVNIMEMAKMDLREWEFNLPRSWELKIGWDSQLPEDMDREFRTWYSQIGLLSQIKIPRHIWFDQTNKNEIHVFCDASKSAYAAVAYMRSEVQGGVHLSLLWSKSRLAPTMCVTIPRLELLACVLGARLVKSISTALTNSCPVTLWTDSSTVMAWLKRKNEWNVFVRNRVQEIRDTVNNENWKFVYGKLNPADLPSRGCSIVQFVSTNWWEGPEWLKGKLNYVQLETALCEVESIINNRALSYISEDDQDLIPLTPQMFLQTNANNEFPELEKIRVNSFTRKYKILSKLNEELKQRFRKEYLGVLMQRAENKRERCIKEGDLVLIGQDNTKRILWPVGKIIKLYLGKDGVNRVARVKTSTGEWLRPVQRLFPLEISSEETPEKASGDKKPLTIKTRSGREVRKPI
ncbi:hypothetical protein LAZ67_14001722, partial [Cordylochernes scorpioides]